jgi:hypothetical protein
MVVNIKGAGTGHQASEPTNEIGCAIFAQVPADSYDVWVNTDGWVDKGGTQEVHTNGQVSAGGLSLTSLVYDRAGKVTVGFDTTWWDPAANAGAGGPRTNASTAWWLSADHADVPAGGIRRYQFKDGSNVHVPRDTLVADKLFPFTGNYGLHTGYCIEENPANQGVPAAWVAANAFQLIDPATTYDRTAAPAKPLRQPALPVRVANGKYTSGANNGKYVWVGGANVVAKLIPESATSQCNNKELIPGIASNASYGLQSYPTDRPPTATHPRSGTAPYNNGLAGMVTKRPTAAIEFDPGLPFGTWQVCAHANLSGTNRRAYATVDNTHTGTAPTTYVIDLNNTTNPPSDSGTCPTTATSSAWPTP